MGKHATKNRSIASRITASVIHRRNRWLGLPPIPLLHAVSGSGGFWDEIIPFLLIGGGLVGWSIFAFLSRRNRNKGRDE